MEAAVVIVAVLVTLVVWTRFVHAKSSAASSPLSGAFTATAVSILFVVAGALGYKLTHGIPFTHRTEWTGTVLWSEIWVGAAAAVVAVFLWRRGLRTLRMSRSLPARGIHRRFES